MARNSARRASRGTHRDGRWRHVGRAAVCGCLLAAVATAHAAEPAAGAPDAAAPASANPLPANPAATDSASPNPVAPAPVPQHTTTPVTSPAQSLESGIAAHGIKLALLEQDEVWANLRGGGRRGTSYDGLTTASLDIDLDKAVHWKGGRFFASAFDIRGHGPTPSLVGSLVLVSNIEATPSLKLFDLWLEQELPNGVNLRLGQEGIDDELMITTYGSLYLQSTFGFPGMLAIDLPSGGPAYPLSTPFARLQWKASDAWTVVGAVYTGDPAPPGPGDPQIRDRNGTAFRLDDHALMIGEVRYTPTPAASERLPTTYKFGIGYHTGRFADQRFDSEGMRLASPASSGNPRVNTGNLAFYGVIDQALWHRAGKPDQGIGAFLRVMLGPGDRNLVDRMVQAGVNWRAPFPSRPDDTAGFAVSYLGISSAAQDYSRDLVGFGHAAHPFASNETVIEATYQAPVTDWLSVQPDAQFVINPGAGVPGPFGHAPLADAFVVGLRVTIKM